MEMIVMPLTEFTPAKARPLTDIEFCAWIGQAIGREPEVPGAVAVA